MFDEPKGLTVQSGDDVGERAAALGLNRPVGLCILPRGFFGSGALAGLVYDDNTQDLRVLLRRAGLPPDPIEPAGVRIPYQAEYDASLVLPTLFLGAAFWSANPHLVSVALNVLSNYVTDWMKGVSGAARVHLSIVVERTDTTKTTRINYDGSPEGFKTVEKAVKDAMK